GFCKNTVYRFLNNTKTNWQRFTTLLSARIINNFMKPLTSDNRKDVFIIDDSLFDRSRSCKTELLARVFDHCSMKYKRGYRMLTLGWSDGNSFVPVNHCLLSAAEDKNLLCEASSYDGRSLAGKRRRQSRRKATEVMLELIHMAQKSGLSAKYVLFDSWFSSPKVVAALKQEHGLDTIAMVKKSSKIKYGYQDGRFNIKEIYSKNRKRRGRSKYLLSINVTVGEEEIPAKIVCVRNKSKKKDWLAILCTDTSLSEEEIIRTYGKRWDIEVFFKSCKSYLRLVKECRSTSYDALNAHTAIVFTRYMMLSVAQRRNTDDKTLCELFFCLMDELDDITFSQSMQIIMNALMDSVMEYFHITEQEMEKFTASFIQRLPKYMQEALKYGQSAA
ncbi:MAG: transposase, partial [Oliverpabstia sp.]